MNLRLRAGESTASHANRMAWGWLSLLFCLGLIGLTERQVQAQPTEHQLKAAVLGNLAKFVEWPEGGTNESIAIGILGHDPFESDLETVLKNVKVKGKGFTFKRSENVADLIGCQIIFLSGRESDRIRELLQRVRTLPILTVGEEAEFTDRGGTVSLNTEDRKVQLSINLEATDRAGLTVNPQLIRLAKVVKRKAGP